MSAPGIHAGGGRRPPAAAGPDAGEIHSVAGQLPRRQVAGAELLPEQAAVSLAPPASATPAPLAALTRLLGPLLTVASPAWCGDPVPRMRALQKRLVEHSLGLAEDDRGGCMAAMMVVEQAVQLRLRLQQMRSSEAELALAADEEKTA